MTHSTDLTLRPFDPAQSRRAQGDPEFMVRLAHHGEGNRTVEWVRVILRRIEG